jgi:hypothetical protein
LDKFRAFAETLGVEVKPCPPKKKKNAKERYSICKVIIENHETMAARIYYELSYEIYGRYLRKSGAKYVLRGVLYFVLCLIPAALLVGAGLLIYSFAVQKHLVTFLAAEAICAFCFLAALIFIYFTEKRTLKRFWQLQNDNPQAADFPAGKWLKHFIFSPFYLADPIITVITNGA